MTNHEFEYGALGFLLGRSMSPPQAQAQPAAPPDWGVWLVVYVVACFFFPPLILVAVIGVPIAACIFLLLGLIEIGKALAAKGRALVRRMP